MFSTKAGYHQGQPLVRIHLFEACFHQPHSFPESKTMFQITWLKDAMSPSDCFGRDDLNLFLFQRQENSFLTSNKTRRLPF